MKMRLVIFFSENHMENYRQAHHTKLLVDYYLSCWFDPARSVFNS